MKITIELDKVFTQAQYSRKLGCTPPLVNRKVKDGIPPADGTRIIIIAGIPFIEEQ